MGLIGLRGPASRFDYGGRTPLGVAIYRVLTGTHVLGMPLMAISSRFARPPRQMQVTAAVSASVSGTSWDFRGFFVECA